MSEAPVTPTFSATQRLRGGADSNLAKILRAGQFAVCAEVSPPVGPNPEAVEREMNTLRGYADAFNFLWG